MNSVSAINPQRLKTWLHDGQELALLDVREQGAFFQHHLLFACCVPFSRLELLIYPLVPRPATRIVLCDDGDDHLAQRAAVRLSELGYSNITVLTGGVTGWRAAGFELFSGINVPSKAFGEYVEQRYQTPHLSAEALAAKQAAGEKLVILDSRPLSEFRNMSIPGGVDCPGAELVYRVFEAAPEPDTQVIVNCAGRTRSIIGAQSLINAGVPNPVAALKDGTMGWKLAGLDLAHGETALAPEPTPDALAKAQAAAKQVGERFGVRSVDAATLADWQQEHDNDTRTLYLFDVRLPEAYLAGHYPGSRSAPGGQLVQATDEYMATRNARVVLIDDNAVQALMTGSWLRQLGWDEVYVLEKGAAPAELETGPYVPLLPPVTLAPLISATDVNARLGQEPTFAVLDLATSLAYRNARIPGAWWGMRTRLFEALNQLPETKQLVLTVPDEAQLALAHLTAAELAALKPDLDIAVLDGGTAAWQAAGLPLAKGRDGELLTCEPNDVWYKPYEHREAIEQAMRDYLTWEVNLVEQIKRDGDARFS